MNATGARSNGGKIEVVRPTNRCLSLVKWRGSQLLAVAPLVALAIGLQAPSAAAQNTGQGSTGPEIVDVRTFGGRTAVARITVRSPKPTSGTLRCGCTRSSVRVDLPTGGERSVWMPMGSTNGFTWDNLVWDVPGSKDPEFPLSTTVTNGRGSTPAMAVMPSALGSRAAPGSVSTPGRAIVDLVEVSPDDVEQRPWVLDGFAGLLTTAKELSSLSPDARLTVMSWVSRGGELMVDDTDPVPGINTQPTETQNAFVGLGVVRRTANTVRTGQWEQALLPPLGANDSSPGWDRPAISLRSAVKPVPAGALLAGLLVYALGVGPMAYRLGRKRNRPMLMWVAIPVTTVATTIGVLAIGLAIRQTAKDQFVLFRVHGDGADRVTIARAVTEGGGATRLQVPAGWIADGKDVKVDLGTVSTASVDLPPGGLSEVRFSGSTPSTRPPFTLSIGPNDTANITNTSGQALRNVFVLRSTSGQLERMELIDIPPGGSRSVPFSPTVSYSSTAAERDRTALAEMAADTTMFKTGALVVVAEIDPASPSGVPGTLTNGARQVRNVAVVGALPAGNRISSRFDQPTATSLVRVDLADASLAHEVFGSSGPDRIWIDGQEAGLVDGPLGAGAVRNGAVVFRSGSAVVQATAVQSDQPSPQPVPQSVPQPSVPQPSTEPVTTEFVQ